MTLGELDRRASRVIARVRAGELAVVSRHGSPVAVILPLREAIAWLPPEAVLEGEARTLAQRFARREFRRAIGRLTHGRWDERDLPTTQVAGSEHGAANGCCAPGGA